MADWNCALELASDRHLLAGSEAALVDAIRRGADLRIYTEFRHNEHIEPGAADPQIIQEVSDFRVAYLIEDRWAAGIMSLRQPISLPNGFGSRPSMSFFLYNQDGQQAIARPFLDGGPLGGTLGPAPLDDFSMMPKYHQLDSWDSDTNGPSSNFVYDFEVFRYYVHDEWQELLSHDADGKVISGSLDALTDAFAAGRDMKVAINGICADLAPESAPAPDHELFVHVGPGYYYTATRLFIGGTQPMVRVRPAIPMRYTSQGWDFGWLMPRTDGFVAMLLYNPYTLTYRRKEGHFAIRWFVR
jgi:hypothetical protein